jgi:ribosomal protein S18 acetylase RimI-like enzyme
MIRYQKLTEKDRLQFDKIFIHSMKNYFPEYKKEVVKHFVSKKYRDEIWDVTIRLGAFEKSKLVGYIISEWYSGGIVYIFWYAVHEKYRRQGIGKQLLTLTEKLAKKTGAHGIKLDADRRNVEFYKKAGYEILGYDENSYYGADNYQLKKHLQKANVSHFFKKRPI